MYQTVWTLLLSKLYGYAIPPIVSTSALSRFLEQHWSDSGIDSIGDRASALYLLTSSEDASAQLARLVGEQARILTSNGAFAGQPSDKSSLLATARVALALERVSVSIPQTATDYLKSGLQAALSRGHSTPEQIQGTSLAAVALIEENDATAVMRSEMSMLAGKWAAELTDTPLDETTLPALAALHQLNDELGQSSDFVASSLASNIVAFPGGWFGFAGSTAPDPQITYYLHYLGGDTRKLDLTSGASERGWMAPSAPSLTASGAWAWVAMKCGIDYGVSHSSLDKALGQEFDKDSPSPTELPYWSELAEYAGYMPSDTMKQKLAPLLRSAVAQDIASNDLISAGRAVSAAARLGIPSRGWVSDVSTHALAARVATGEPSVLDVYLIQLLISDSATAEPATEGTSTELAASLVPQRSGVAYKLSAKSADVDLASTALASVVLASPEDAREQAAATFAYDGWYCDSRAGGRCVVGIVDITAAVLLIDGRFEQDGFIW